MILSGMTVDGEAMAVELGEGAAGVVFVLSPSAAVLRVDTAAGTYLFQQQTCRFHYHFNGVIEELHDLVKPEDAPKLVVIPGTPKPRKPRKPRAAPTAGLDLETREEADHGDES